MRRALLAAALLLATVPGAASAAPFGELPFRPVSGAANCVRATGLPGELSRWTRNGVELSTAGATGILSHTTVLLSGMTECPVVVSDPSGFAALAAATKDGVRLAVREPLAPPGTSVSLDSGLWVAQTTIPAEHAGNVRVAVSARGDVLVAWAESSDALPPRVRARAVLRPPGGPYGATQRIGGVAQSLDLAVGLSAGGEALLATADERAVRVATAPPGGAFGVPRRLASAGFNHPLALAVAADGHALLAAADAGEIGVFDREPGAAFARRLTIPANADTRDVAVALGAGGVGAVAWQSGGEVSLVRRAAGAAFGPPAVLHAADPVPTMFGSEAILTFSFGGDGVPFDGPSRLRALLGPDGRALLTWGTDGGAGFVGSVDPAGATELARVGSTIRDTTGLTPLALTERSGDEPPGRGSGTRAIAWADNNAPQSIPPFAGRLHLALEGAPAAPAAPVPELDVGAPVDASLRPAESLVLPVRCNAACDIRAVSGGFFDPGATLSRAGMARLRIGPLSEPIAPARPGPVKVKLSWSAPGAHEVQERTVSVHLRRLPRPPFPRLLNVRARRAAGGVVDVRWSTDVPARDVGFSVYGSRARSITTVEPPSFGSATGKGRRQFHLKLTRAARVRWVRVFAVQSVGRRQRHVLVRVS